jgi:hypothetical protein
MHRRWAHHITKKDAVQNCYFRPKNFEAMAHTGCIGIIVALDHPQKLFNLLSLLPSLSFTIPLVFVLVVISVV